MRYVVFDLEFNQGFEETLTDKNCPFEIIQIGATTLNDQLEEISSFNQLIKPQIYKEINPYVNSLTGLTVEKLSNEDTFDRVFTSFLTYINEGDIIFCTWGMSDIKELFRNAQYYRLPISSIPKKYINLQPYVSKYLHFPKNICVSLRDAINFLKIDHSNHFHDAYYDALYTSKIFQLIADPNIPIQIYDPSGPPREPRPKKQQLNTDKLISQFEKMFKREMTSNEQTVIKLAYLMGKTGQFLE